MFFKEWMIKTLLKWRVCSGWLPRQQGLVLNYIFVSLKGE